LVAARRRRLGLRRHGKPWDPVFEPAAAYEFLQGTISQSLAERAVWSSCGEVVEQRVSVHYRSV